MKHFSKLGLWLAGIYAVITGSIFYYAFTCSGWYCGVVMVLPIMPWPLLMEAIPDWRVLFGFLDSVFGAFVFLFLNIIILYFIGVLIERMVRNIKNRNNVSPLN